MSCIVTPMPPSTLMPLHHACVPWHLVMTRAYRQATAGEGDIIHLQCESDLVVMAADGVNA